MSDIPTNTLVEKESSNHPEPGEEFDVIIIGAGPAGMAAAVGAARAKLKTLIVEKALPGGQASTAYRIYNYLGFPGILGEDLARKMEEHLEEYDISQTCEGVEDILNINGANKVIRTELGNEYSAKAIIIATGLEPKPLEPDLEQKFLGRGLSYYAQADSSEYAGQTVAVIGGGNCACYASEYLSETVDKLYLIHRSDDLKAVKNLKQKILNNPKIDIIWNSKLDDLFGIDKLEKIKIYNTQTEQHTWLDVRGCFVYMGRKPSKTMLHVDVQTDEEGYIITDNYMRTNISGIYAVGDIRAKQIRQIATAVSDGMVAAVNIERDFFR